MSILSYGKMAGQRAFNVVTPVKKDENSRHKFIALKDFFTLEFDDIFFNKCVFFAHISSLQ